MQPVHVHGSRGRFPAAPSLLSRHPSLQHRVDRAIAGLLVLCSIPSASAQPLNTVWADRLAHHAAPSAPDKLVAQVRDAARSWLESDAQRLFTLNVASARPVAPVRTFGPIVGDDRLGMPPEPGTARPPHAVPSPAKRLEPRVVALAPMIEPIARLHQVDHALLMAIIHVESRGNPKARSSRGAMGLMQVMPRTGSHYGARDLFDKQQNITAGARFIRDLMNRYDGRIDLVLAAYNAGSGAVMKYGGRVPPYPETQQYVLKVASYHAAYRALQG